MYANVRFWEAKPGVHGRVARSWGKEGLFWEHYRFSGSGLWLQGRIEKPAALRMTVLFSKILLSPYERSREKVLF